MSISDSSLKEFSLSIVIKCAGCTLVCTKHRKPLKNYMAVRYHFKNHHTLTTIQFEKVSKMGRLLGVKK